MGLSLYRKYGMAASKLAAPAKEGRLSHAYIIEGGANLDKEGFAKSLFQALICKQAPGEGCGRCIDCRKIADENHEDLHVVRPEDTTKGKTGTSTIKDAQIEELQAELKQKPTACDHNMALVIGADTMTMRAETRFLKTLEEPTEGTVIVLLSENTEELLPTINSRCVQVRLYDLAGKDDNEMTGSASKLIRMVSEGAFFFDIKEELDKAVKTRDDSYRLLDGLETELGRVARKESDVSKAGARGISEALGMIEEARRDIKLGAGYNYRLRDLMLKFEDII